MNQKKIGDLTLEPMLILLAIYVAISSFVFRFRHPWMTQTEILFNFHKALMFEKIDYKEFKKQYEKTNN